jgi:hypothetical protein
MILGYFTAPKNKQDDVLHTIGSVLNFSPTEFERVRYIKMFCKIVYKNDSMNLVSLKSKKNKILIVHLEFCFVYNFFFFFLLSHYTYNTLQIYLAGQSLEITRLKCKFLYMDQIYNMMFNMSVLIHVIKI